MAVSMQIFTDQKVGEVVKRIDTFIVYAHAYFKMLTRC